MERYRKTIFLLCTAYLFSIISAASQSTNDLLWPELKKEHLPGTYWWWMGSAVDKENLTYNLEQLRNAGIGNAHIIPIYGAQGQEENYINFLSPTWMDMLSHTLNEAVRLDMNVDMSTTTGWPFGGSHVGPRDAAAKMVYETYTISGGEQLGEKIPARDLQCLIAYSNKGEIIDLTGKSSQEMPAGEWQVYAVWQKGTGQQVKRAAPGNEGPVLDPFSVKSLETYLQRYDRAFSKDNGSLLRAQYHDSYEYYSADWTEDLFSEFQSRRGYDLQHHLPELTGQGTAENVSRIIADYRTTLAELHLEYIQEWTRWSHRYGWITRNEAHGAPANLLDLYAAADIPETETFGATKFDIPGLPYKPENISTSAPPDPLVLRFASSAAHVSGKQLVASETCTWLRDHFKASLAQTKPEIDQLFLSGINHIFYHGNAYSPKDAEWPGWMFYASTHFEQKNAFWRDFPELNSYVGRCQSVLQSGKSANEILLYWPLADIWHKYSIREMKMLTVHSTRWLTESPFGILAGWLHGQGYAFDYLSDNQLQELNFQNGELQAVGGDYKTILVPATQHIPLETLEKLITLVRAGATIIIHDRLPGDVPGWFDLEKRRNALQTSLRELEFNASGKKMLSAKVGEGQILLGPYAEVLLSYAGIVPEPITGLGIEYIRRSHPEGYHYFISNLSGRSLDTWVPMATSFRSAVILDPRSSNKSGVAATRNNEGSSEIYLQLQPGESLIIRTFSERQASGPPWVYLQKEEISDGMAGETIKVPIEIKGEWKVEFIEGGPALPASFTTEDLASWTELGDHDAKRFAGTARYTATFDMPENLITDNWLLELGEVRESARVSINGNELGTLWSIPFSISSGNNLKKGLNTLDTEVTNLSANRLRDLDHRGVKWQNYFFVNVFYEEFDASKWPLMDSGLMGPVRLIPYKAFDPLNEK